MALVKRCSKHLAFAFKLIERHNKGKGYAVEWDFSEIDRATPIINGEPNSLTFLTVENRKECGLCKPYWNDQFEFNQAHESFEDSAIRVFKSPAEYSRDYPIRNMIPSLSLIGDLPSHWSLCVALPNGDTEFVGTYQTAHDARIAAAYRMRTTGAITRRYWDHFVAYLLVDWRKHG